MTLHASGTQYPSPPAVQAPDKSRGPQLAAGTPWEFWVLRALLIVAIAGLCFWFAPFGLHGLPAAAVGFLGAMVLLIVEFRLRSVPVNGLVGGAVGALLGALGALLVTLVIAHTVELETTKSFLEYSSLGGFIYLGLILGARRGEELRPNGLAATTEKISSQNGNMKLLDTSVLIDGRIADICEAYFLDGVLGVPQFVLHELQMVADSSDPLKRQRGRRGLEVLARIQKMPHLEVRILDDDFPLVGDVDHKLVELARRTGAKMVTNDFNLNRVATVQGLSVLNVNLLANAMKPVVLPGESMQVLILREGKEPSQGVAFLNDGTMVVVDGARRLINKTVDILVTSVHQTTAGKMIFGRIDERAEPGPGAAGRSGAGHARDAVNGNPERKGAPHDSRVAEQRSPERKTSNPAPESVSE